MTNTNPAVPDDLLVAVRKLLPKAPMSYRQARIKTQQLALRMRKLLGSTDARLCLDFIERIPGVTVTMLTPTKMEALTKSPTTSGATAVRRDGTYHIYIKDNNAVTHCRFTLAHELFHVLVGPQEPDVFADFGHGDDDLHRQRVESIADHFAANLLMPSAVLKRKWCSGVQDVRKLAATFGVSEEAMRIRLRTVGLMRSVTKKMFYRQARRGARLFFRQASALSDSSQDAYREVQSCPGAVLTVNEACQRLRVSKWTLYRLINERQLTTIKLGARRLIPESALWALINKLSGEEAA